MKQLSTKYVVKKGDVFPWSKIGNEMVKVNFRGAGGELYSVDAAEGTSLMRAALEALVPGIDADCGGACACGTCHVYVDGLFYDLVGEPESQERDMLQIAVDIKPNSRLSCQIKLAKDLDGIIVDIPESQF